MFCLGLLLWLPAIAQDSAQDNAQDEELDTITVVAEPEPQTGDVQHQEYTGSYRRIGKQELQRQDVNLGDILANETGVQFRQVGGLGTLTTATVRAASSAQTGVFLDGIKLNSAGNNTIDLSLLELLNLDSVDVYRGSAPAQLSSASIGGAINLQSLNTDSTHSSTTASLTTGSFKTNRVQFAHRSSHNQLDVVAAASREQSNNRFELHNDNTTPLNPFDDRREKRNNAQAAKLSAMSRIGFRWNRNTRTDVLVQATGRQIGIPEWRNNAENEASYDTDALEFQLVNRHDGIGDWNTSFSLFQHAQNNHYLDAKNQVGLGAQDTLSNSKTVGLKSYWERIGEHGTFSFNTSLRNELLDSIDLQLENQNYSAERLSLLSTVQYAYFSMNERLLITPSVRLQRSDDKYSGVVRLNGRNRADSKINTQLGLRFEKSEQLTLRSSLGIFSRDPAFSELYGSRGLIEGNNKLLPEKGINAEFGISYSPSPAVQLNTTFFGSWRDELIVLEFNSLGIGRSSNTGKANVLGFEVDSDWVINKLLTLRVNTTFQQSQNFSPNPALNKRELPGEARLSSHAKMQYHNGNTRLWFESNYKSDFFYDVSNSLPSKGYLLHNVGYEYQWSDISIGITANNIGGGYVEDFNGFQRPGRSYYFSVNYRL